MKRIVTGKDTSDKGTIPPEQFHALTVLSRKKIGVITYHLMESNNPLGSGRKLWLHMDNSSTKKNSIIVELTHITEIVDLFNNRLDKRHTNEND